MQNNTSQCYEEVKNLLLSYNFLEFQDAKHLITIKTTDVRADIQIYCEPDAFQIIFSYKIRLAMIEQQNFTRADMLDYIVDINQQIMKKNIIIERRLFLSLIPYTEISGLDKNKYYRQNFPISVNKFMNRNSKLLYSHKLTLSKVSLAKS